MKLGIITDSVDYKARGIGRVIRDFCYYLSENKFSKDNEVTLIHEINNHDEIYSLQNLNELLIPSKKILFGREVRKIFTLPNNLRKGNFDVIHDLANVGPFFNSINSKAIQTVYDLTPVIFPSYHPFASVYRTKIGMKLIKNNVDHYITISNATANDLTKLYKIDPENITTIYPALGLVMKNHIDEQKNSPSIINGDYILFVGTIEPRKNISGLLNIFEKVHAKNPDIKLVIVGNLGWKYKNSVNKIQNHKYSKDIIWFSDASDKKLAKLYIHAKMLLYPTLYEGFGLPVVEAIYAGIPVLTSNNSSLPELINDEEMLVNTDNISEFAKKANNLIQNSNLRTRIISKLEQKLSLFSWEENVRQTLKVYNKYL